MTRRSPVRRVLAAATLLVLATLGWLSVREAWRHLQGVPHEQVGPGVFRVIPTDTPYQRWIEAARKRHVPVYQGLVIQDVRTEPLTPWDDMGVNGLYIQMADYQMIDGWILELPPGGSTKPQRHLFEAGLYFFGGSGHLTLRPEGQPPLDVPVKYRTLFSVPLNMRYQIFNTSDRPLRVVAVTSFPFVLNAMENERFIFENPFEFRERYDAEGGFLTRRDHPRPNLTVTNYVEDALAFPLDAYEHRGEDTTNIDQIEPDLPQIETEFKAEVARRREGER
jgi:hypothetical protein